MRPTKPIYRIISTYLVALLAVVGFTAANIDSMQAKEPQIILKSWKGLGKELYINIDFEGELCIKGGTSLEGDRYRLEDDSIVFIGDITHFDCSSQYVTNLIVRDCPNLKTLHCTYNSITYLELTNLPSLTTLDCSQNKIWELDLSGCPKLRSVEVQQNKISGGYMTALMNSLPITGGIIYVYRQMRSDGNKCTATDVAIANARRWNVQGYSVSKTPYDYVGSGYLNTGKLTLQPSYGGTIHTNLNVPFDKVPFGSEIHVGVNPAEGYQLRSLMADDLDITESRKFIFTNPTTVVATFERTMCQVTLESVPNGKIAIKGYDKTLLQEIKTNTSLEVIDTPNENYELVSLKINGAQIFPNRTFAVRDNTTVTPQFALKSYPVTYEIEGEGTCTIEGAQNLEKVPHGTVLTIRATPNMGWVLSSVTGNEEPINQQRITITEATHIKASFTQGTYKVFQKIEGEGTLKITGAPNLDKVTYGTVLTTKTTPAEGWHFVSLKSNGKNVANNQVTVTEATEIRAVFAPNTYPVTTETTGEGTIETEGATDLRNVPHGSKLTIRAVPIKGWTTTSFKVNGIDVTTEEITITRATQITAVFDGARYKVTKSIQGEGTVEITGVESLNDVLHGSSLKIKATPSGGSQLVSIFVNNKPISGTNVTIESDTHIRVVFAKDIHKVKTIIEGEGLLELEGVESLDRVPLNTNLTISATPELGWTLNNMLVNGEPFSNAFIKVTEDLEIKAIFTPYTYKVEEKKEGKGELKISGYSDLSRVPYGTELTIEATPDEEWVLAKITVNGKAIEENKITIDRDVEIKAIFEQQMCNITMVVKGGGMYEFSGIPSLKQIPLGSIVTFYAIPQYGYHLEYFSVNGTPINVAKPNEVLIYDFEVRESSVVNMVFAPKPTSVEEIDEKALLLFPNPATDRVFVTDAEANAHVVLRSMEGQLLLETKTDSDGHLSLNVHSYPRGNYLLSIGAKTFTLLLQ